MIRPRTLTAVLALLTALLTLAPGARAEPPSKTRTAQAILKDHITAIGGAAALKRHRNMHVVRKVAIRGMGITGTEERYGTSKNQMFVVTKMPGVGTARQGSDGRSFWAEDPINGLRLLTGAEKEQAAIDAHWNAELHLPKLYKEIRVVQPPAGAPTDRPLECLELHKSLGQFTVACFDAATHHRVFISGKQPSPQGDIPFRALFSDFRAYGGVTLPALEETTAGPSTFEARLVSVTFDGDLDPALFRPPAAATEAEKKPAGKRAAP